MSRSRKVVLVTSLVVVSAAFFLWQLAKIDVARRDDCAMRMVAAGSRLSLYNDLWGRLPDPIRYPSKSGSASEFATDCDHSGTPLSSWRLLVIGRFGGYEQLPNFNLPWNHQSNLVFEDDGGKPFTFPTLIETIIGQHTPKSSFTSIFAIVGKGTAFGDGKSEAPRSLSQIDCDTILAIQIDNSSHHWMAPGDFTIDNESDDSLASPHRYFEGIRGPSYVLFADVQVWLLSETVKRDDILGFCRVDDALTNDREEVLGQYALKRHPASIRKYQ